MKQQPAKTVGFKSGERNIFFHLLTACNLICRHCYINPDQHGKTAVSREIMDQWLQLFMSQDKESNVVFLGGEPTMHPDLVHGIRMAKRLGYGSVTVDTNGYLFHNFLDKITPDVLDFLSFSLDGPSAAVNDPLRGKGVFDVCTANLRRAAALGFNISLIYTVSRLNIDYLAKMPPLLADWGVKRFFIQVIGIRGKTAGRKQETLQLAPDEWLEIVPAVARKAANLGVQVTYPKVFLDLDEKFECAGRVAENYFIFPNGRVYLCPLCEDYPINAYRIKENKLIKNAGLIEEKLFRLDIPEGCVMNKILQPDNLQYLSSGLPRYKISCCLLKQEIKAVARHCHER